MSSSAQVGLRSNSSKRSGSRKGGKLEYRRRRWFSCEKLKKKLYPVESIDDLLNPVFYRDVVVEGMLCFYVMACIIWVFMTLDTVFYTPNTTHIGLFAGSIVMLLIEAYGPLSGALMNPAACWGFFIAGRISFARTILYTGVEVGGCIAGSMCAFYLSPEKNRNAFKAIKPGPGLDPIQGMFIEAILTFNLLFVALICTDPKSKTALMPSWPIAWCIGVGTFAAGTHTGGTQNPIVSFGTAVVTQDFQHNWLYWVGPYVGATAGTISYLLVDYIKDHFEHHLPPREHPGLKNPSHRSTEQCEEDTQHLA